ncbi:UPF0182 family protein [Tepidibacter hydrothermalis]|uniref:UPF0182 protein P4S50_18530 n=1 Tax=Tepidibacter hydrothermalis TaxID=3036126 RepID=A0ABY8EHL4_9FIRM|nr:UPF0182 family protein [Tepidibacter hydrothermalis]WFD10320.1 UPF0182 family protein [Tepidibacter hydrothermalis]
MSKSKNILTALLVVVIVTVVGFFSQIITFLSDYNWFKEVGYTSTFIKQIFAKLYIAVPIFLILAVLIYIYLIGIKKSYYLHMNVITSKEEEKPIKIITLLGTIIISLLFSLKISSNLWMEILQFKNATSFNIKDPIFNHDVSFYVFKLPLINQILNILVGLLVFLFIITILYYLMLASFKKLNKFDDNVRNLNDMSNIGDTLKNVVNLALNQIAVIGVVFFIILAIKSYLGSFELLYSPRGVAYGASYTDVNINLWVYRLSAIISLVSAIFVVVAYKKRRLRTLLIGPILLIVISIGSTIVQTGVQNFIVSPNEIAKEKKFLEYNIDYTKNAYNLKEVKEENFLAEQNITIEDILKNEQTLSNISINDYRPTKETYNQLQTLRPYYNFNDVDIDRYMIDGKLNQVFLSAREINQDRLDEQAQTWLNKHIKYTHGYGLTMSPVNEITPGGEPKMIIKDIPPVSLVEGLNVERPEIYFGELTNDYIVTNTSEKEFDYPKGETNAFSEYKGKAGINLTLFNRILYSIDQGSLKFLVASSIDSNSKIILNRNIEKRVKKIAPFLSFDDDPYLVVSEGKMYWMIDGYTYTSKYPYSQPYSDNRINYIRNSFKVVIDAYDGTTDFYIADKNDPMINTYAKIFPDLFKSMDDMPEGIKSHIRYPQTIFDIQAKIYETYHMKDTEVFYNKEDKWEVAKKSKNTQSQEEGESLDIESNYITFKLPNEDEAEFLLTIPYTPQRKQNMTALFVARNDEDKYGQLIVYKFPKDKNILGPEQIEAKIDKDPEISKDLTQWNTGGSTVIRGTLLTIPIENSILYVEPLYIKSDSQNSIPAVEKIFVAYKDKVVMKDTLEQALNTMFKSDNQNVIIDETPDESNVDLDKNQLIKKANDLYNKAGSSLKDGDFEAYGRYLKELGDVLNKLAK